MAIVGGWVRDKILNKSSNDIDICLHRAIYPLYKSMIQRELKRLNIKFEAKTHVLRNKIKQGSEITTLKFDFAGVKFDLDLVTMSGKNFNADSWTRDFKINAIYFNIETMTINDPRMGISDLKNNLMTTVHHNMDQTFKDKTRVLRLMRQAANLNIPINQSLKLFIRTSIDTSEFTNMRIGRLELAKICKSLRFYQVCINLQSSNLLNFYPFHHAGEVDAVFENKEYI
jgi:tRNA nucleotidyltransferase/poly(A) polymerase